MSFLPFACKGGPHFLCPPLFFLLTSHTSYTKSGGYVEPMKPPPRATITMTLWPKTTHCVCLLIFHSKKPRKKRLTIRMKSFLGQPTIHQSTIQGSNHMSVSQFNIAIIPICFHLLFFVHSPSRCLTFATVISNPDTGSFPKMCHCCLGSSKEHRLVMQTLLKPPRIRITTSRTICGFPRGCSSRVLLRSSGTFCQYRSYVTHGRKPENCF
jgi:hypothetical protein